jgi:hypothetical protein
MPFRQENRLRGFFGLFALTQFKKSMQMTAKKGRKNAICELLDWKSVFLPSFEPAKRHKTP